ncbi:MAG TPA: hypothetical protein VMO47_02405 [Rhodothermales bacterium]|nr:hypothetical protein [Rhodothermales bacterium]
MMVLPRIRFLLPSFFAILVTVVASSTSFAQKEPAGPLQFRLKIDQLPGLTLEVVDGFEWVTLVETSLATDRMTGKTTYPTITLRHVADGSNLVWAWYKNSAMLGKADTRPGTIELVDGNGLVARSYVLPMMLPTRYRLINAPDGVVEELEVVTVNPTGEVK